MRGWDNPIQFLTKKGCRMSRIFLRIFIFIGLFFATFANAIPIATDYFDTDMDGWNKVNASDQVYWDSGRLFINRDDRAGKTYNFGASYANETVEVSIIANPTNNWEPWSDKINIFANGTTVYNAYADGSIKFEATLNGSGSLTLTIMPNTNNNNEDMYVGSVIIEYFPRNWKDGNDGITALDLANQIQGTGLTITNPQISSYNPTQFGTFTDGNATNGIGIDKGIILTTMDVKESFTSNSDFQTSIKHSGYSPTWTDSDLLGIDSRARYDTIVFEFDVTLDDNTQLLMVDYQFGSEEYNEYVGSQFNDAFGFFISGGDLTQTYNIARVVDASDVVTATNVNSYDPVTVNNINNGSVGQYNDGTLEVLTNASYFIDNCFISGASVPNCNQSSSQVNVEYDGISRTLHAIIDNLTPGQTYHFKMAIADTGDPIFDTGIFVSKIQGIRTPKLCYDFAASIGEDIFVPLDDNRNFEVSQWGTEPLFIKTFIRSEEAEMKLSDTRLSVDLNVSDSKLKFNIGDTKVTLPNQAAYINTYELNTTTHSFAIGDNFSPVKGGDIGARESLFSKAAFKFLTGDVINGHFDLTINTSIALPLVTINRTVSTTGGTLTLCNRNATYDPQWLQLNIERGDSTSGQMPKDRYPLYTQIAGRSFAASLVSYSAASGYTTETVPSEPITADIEFINVDGFQNRKDAGFDSICEQPDNDFYDGRFGKLDGVSRKSISNFVSDKAIRNAAFRMWVLVEWDENGTASPVSHNCSDPNDETCFKNLYNDTSYYKLTGKCDSACSTVTGCYECLRKNFSIPICSRDNFSIRPKGFKINIEDDNESFAMASNAIVSNDGNIDDNNASLAAGYNYLLNLTALAHDDSTTALGYYNDSFKAEKLENTPGGNVNAIVLEFKDNFAKCNDTNTTTYHYVFQDGIIQTLKGANRIFTFSNVGKYNFWMDDSNWTIVDQARYEYKTTFGDDKQDDCFPDDAASPDVGKVGCNTRSIIDSNNGYNNVDLDFNPYSFNLSSVNMKNSPDNANTSWLFTNNLTEDPNMGARFDGRVTAIAKGGVATNNFVKECAATDVNLDFNITSTPEEGSITATDINGTTYGVGINNILIGVVSSSGTQSAIPKEYFTKDNNGSSAIDLRYNYDRFNYMVTNPIVATFHTLVASAPDANASAEMESMRIPDGKQNYDRNITFLKGRVYTILEKDNPDGHDVDNDNIDTIFTVEAYCDDMLTCPDMIHDLNNDNSIVGNNGWYPMKSHVHSADPDGFNDGKIVELKDEDSEGVIINPALNIQFNNYAETSNVNIAEGTASNDVKIKIYPDPWLKYDDNSSEAGNPYFILNFESLSDEWTGIGNTGHKIDINASKGSMDRTTW